MSEPLSMSFEQTELLRLLAAINWCEGCLIGATITIPDFVSERLAGFRSKIERMPNA
jgi:hypothetical protein